MEELQELLIKLYDTLVDGYNTDCPNKAICDGLELLESHREKIFRNNYETLRATLEKSKQDLTILTEVKKGVITATRVLDDVVLWDDVLEAMRIIEE